MLSTDPSEKISDSHYDATSMADLQRLLRSRLAQIKQNPQLGSLRSIGCEIGVSHTWLGDFRDGKAVGMNIMNRLANYFGIRYYIENYQEEEVGPIG